MAKYVVRLAAVAVAAGLALQGLSATSVRADDAKKFSNVDLAPGKVGNDSDAADIRKLCGTKKIKVALSDGFGGNGYRKIARRELELEAAKCPNITEVKYTDGGGNPEKQIADIKALGAQHYDVIVAFPDAGQALVGAGHEVTQQGSAFVPYQTSEYWPGVAGVDDAVNVTTIMETWGAGSGQWIADTLHGKGNVIILGGAPGSGVDVGTEKGWKSVFAKYPDIKVLEPPVYTGWDGAKAQKAMAGLLAKYSKIDAVITTYGQVVLGAIRAYEAVGRKLPLFTSAEENDQSCYWQDHHADNPDFQIAASSGATWMTRLALRKGVAAAEGINDPEPSYINMPIVQDSTSKDPAKALKCDRSLPPDADLTASLTHEELEAVFKK